LGEGREEPVDDAGAARHVYRSSILRFVCGNVAALSPSPDWQVKKRRRFSAQTSLQLALAAIPSELGRERIDRGGRSLAALFRIKTVPGRVHRYSLTLEH
jgi:hypothetical protein